MTTTANLLRVLFLGAALLQCPAFAVDGTDLPGSDYDNFDAPSALACRTTCGGESNCQAYTWVKPGIQGPSGRCWLKTKLPAIVKNACCDSGPRNFINKRDLHAELNVDRPGSDFKDFDENGPAACEAACAGNSICHSWTHVRAGVQGPTGHCWLKTRVARPVASSDTVSGVKYIVPSAGPRPVKPHKPVVAVGKDGKPLGNAAYVEGCKLAGAHCPPRMAVAFEESTGCICRE